MLAKSTNFSDNQATFHSQNDSKEKMFEPSLKRGVAVMNLILELTLSDLSLKIIPRTTMLKSSVRLAFTVHAWDKLH
jgi:hypothetical protein